jgi:hypothetical protein
MTDNAGTVTITLKLDTTEFHAAVAGVTQAIRRLKAEVVVIVSRSPAASLGKSPR